MSENKKVIYIVGMGPGSISGMSGDAVEALHKQRYDYRLYGLCGIIGAPAFPR